MSRGRCGRVCPSKTRKPVIGSDPKPSKTLFLCNKSIQIGRFGTSACWGLSAVTMTCAFGQTPIATYHAVIHSYLTIHNGNEESETFRNNVLSRMQCFLEWTSSCLQDRHVGRASDYIANGKHEQLQHVTTVNVQNKQQLNNYAPVNHDSLSWEHVVVMRLERCIAFRIPQYSPALMPNCIEASVYHGSFCFCQIALKHRVRGGRDDYLQRFCEQKRKTMQTRFDGVSMWFVITSWRGHFLGMLKRYWMILNPCSPCIPSFLVILSAYIGFKMRLKDEKHLVAAAFGSPWKQCSRTSADEKSPSRRYDW